jgi:hypothetical protein
MKKSLLEDATDLGDFADIQNNTVRRYRNEKN